MASWLASLRSSRHRKGIISSLYIYIYIYYEAFVCLFVLFYFLIFNLFLRQTSLVRAVVQECGAHLTVIRCLNLILLLYIMIIAIEMILVMFLSQL